MRMLGITILALLWTGCETPGGYTLREHRAAINKRCQETLEEVYQKHPTAKGDLERAPGFAVFRQGGLKVALPGAGDGYGVAVANSNGKRTFMRMGGVAPGFQAVFVFRTEDTLDRFVDRGWEFGGPAETGLRVYSVGGAALSGTRYWTDRTLNQRTSTP